MLSWRDHSLVIAQTTTCKEMKVVAHQQIAKALTGQTNLTVKYNGTTKTVGHMVETEIAKEKQTLLVGLSQQGGGTAVEYVDTIMHDTGAIETSSFVDIKSHIVNTMTDRCKTNDAVDRIMGQKQVSAVQCTLLMGWRRNVRKSSSRLRSQTTLT